MPGLISLAVKMGTTGPGLAPGLEARGKELLELKAVLIRPSQMSLNVTQLAPFKSL